MTQRNEHDTIPPSMDPAPSAEAIEAPTNFWGIVRRLGPGLIIAGSIVGSGELIATTKTGAQAGMTLLWLVIIGCIIKVFVQIELGRYTITWGETTLSALDQCPGPRLRVGWIVWFWLLMMAFGMAQLGGIVGGVGQAMALSFPVRGDYKTAIEIPSVKELGNFLNHRVHWLSPWELQLLVLADDGTVDEAKSAGTLTEAEAEFLRSVADGTRSRLAGLAPSSRAAETLLVATREWLAAEKALAESRASENARRTFRAASRALDARLEELNRAATPLQNDGKELNRDETRRLRGQIVFGHQLALLDRAGYRALKAIREIQRLLDEERALAEATAAKTTAESELTSLRAAVAEQRAAISARFDPYTYDDKIWAALATVVTMFLLVLGRYGLIQNLSTVLVVAFTFITIGNVFALQSTDQWRVPMSEFLHGLSFRLPEGDLNTALTTALAAFGIIGVGASELIAYPYWCLEKGYARFTGVRTSDDAWARRARGWMRVMHYDAFLSMGVYTIATLAFYIMGVSVLFKDGRDPEGMRMVSTLSTAYVPVFGEHARWLFLIGAFAVLYSTFLVATAGHARTLTDVLKVARLLPTDSQRSHDRSIKAFGIVLPIISFALFYTGMNPVRAVLLAGTMQALLLPMIGFGALYFRYTRSDPRIAPGRLWDLLLIVSFIGLFITGVWGCYTQGRDLIAAMW